MEILDQIGIRVVVLSLLEIDKVKEAILTMLNEAEVTQKEPLSESEFGYEALHITLLIPDDILEKFPVKTDFFELQIVTLFQHAWAQGTHNILYKGANYLTKEQRKMLKFLAAQVWGADKIIEGLIKMKNSSKNQESFLFFDSNFTSK